MNVSAAKKQLEDAAKAYAESPSHVQKLYDAALEYSRAKHRGWKNRDAWKTRKRLNDGWQR